MKKIIIFIMLSLISTHNIMSSMKAIKNLLGLSTKKPLHQEQPTPTNSNHANFEPPIAQVIATPIPTCQAQPYHTTNLSSTIIQESINHSFDLHVSAINKNISITTRINPQQNPEKIFEQAYKRGVGDSIDAILKDHFIIKQKDIISIQDEKFTEGLFTGLGISLCAIMVTKTITELVFKK